MINLGCSKSECLGKTINIKMDKGSIIVECLNCGDMRRFKLKDEVEN